jgi:hypothetical protein
MRHASIQTTMNIYGKAMTDSKRQAHNKTRFLLLGVNGSFLVRFESVQPIEWIGCGGWI